MCKWWAADKLIRQDLGPVYPRDYKDSEKPVTTSTHESDSVLRGQEEASCEDKNTGKSQSLSLFQIWTEWIEPSGRKCRQSFCSSSLCLRQLFLLVLPGTLKPISFVKSITLYCRMLYFFTFYPLFLTTLLPPASFGAIDCKVIRVATPLCRWLLLLSLPSSLYSPLRYLFSLYLRLTLLKCLSACENRLCYSSLKPDFRLGSVGRRGEESKGKEWADRIWCLEKLKEV